MFALDENNEWKSQGHDQEGDLTATLPTDNEPTSHIWWIEIERNNTTDENHSTFGTNKVHTEAAKLTMTEVTQGLGVTKVKDGYLRAVQRGSLPP